MAATAPKSTVKRDKLRKIELQMQKEWEEAHLYQADTPSSWSIGEDRSKFLVTFPYPYMNGALHLGHTFTVTKSEFAARYEKLKGKNVLFPFGFHATGMPIKACADKLAAEIAKYGNPPKFPAPVVETPEPAVEEQHAAEEPATAAAAAPVKGKKEQKGKDVGEFHGKKTKLVAKTGTKKQWEIMEDNGVPQEQIAEFVDAKRWLKYFPTVGMEDLKYMGLATDWRRSFITTDANPYYDSFVRWQFTHLKEQGKVEFGKRPAVYSPLDGQPCADHERSEGEGVGPQEYVLIKLEVVQPCEPCPLLRKLGQEQGKKVFLVAGTLRPETMVGQVCCWALPTATYGAYEVAPGEVFVCTARAARNMAFQDLSLEPGKVTDLGEIPGSELIGVALKAPLTSYEKIHVLPMNTIDPEKSTGVVTCVPSDSPDDYINFTTLKNKPEYRKKLGVKDEWIMPYELIPIITIPELGDRAAETVCQQLNIKSPNDKALLETAKEKTYSKGFYQGEMIAGSYKGMKVKDAKPLVREDLLRSKQAVIYNEPAERVVSRSGDVCVVALCDQWYLKYGEADWRAKTEGLLKSMELFHTESAGVLQFALGWMSQWACSRTFGLGTRLPWDEKWLIESLSDSTIYMAYYTIAHLLHGGTLDGSVPGPLGIKPEQMTLGVWDHIFLNKPIPADCTIAHDKLAAMRKEFEYWYGVDLRVSGKDLLQNHLLFSLYNHTAIWGEDKTKWPKAFRANGHLLLNGAKMAKSTGNFLTLRGGVDNYSADGMRIALADAGDAVDDANFVATTADSALLRLYTLVNWIEEVMADQSKLSDSPSSAADWYDKVFASQMSKAINDADKAYSRYMFRDALIRAWGDLQAARDLYRFVCESLGVPMKKALVMRYIEVQALIISPIAPHFADYVWHHILNKAGFIWSEGKWPEAGQIDSQALLESEYTERVLSTFHIAIRDHCDPAKAKKKAAKGAPLVIPPAPTVCEILVAKAFPDWIIRTHELVNAEYAKTGKIPDSASLVQEFSKDETVKKVMKKALSKASAIQESASSIGAQAALSLTLPFDEMAMLSSRLPYFTKALRLTTLTIHVLDTVDEKTLPGCPGFAVLQ